MRIDVISLFPQMLQQAVTHGIVGRAYSRGLFNMHCWNPRDYAKGGYRRVDDRAFGGGPGMVMSIDPLLACLKAVHAASSTKAKTVYLSPQGVRLTQSRVRGLALSPRLVLICGRYEGVDERFLQNAVDEEISIGDYVLSGGELAASVVVDAVTRLIPGALNDVASADQDSFEGKLGLLDYPHYTHPVEHCFGTVPEVLRSGNHAAIARWRRQQSLGRTWLRRPDILDHQQLSKEDMQLLTEFQQSYFARKNNTQD